MLFPEEDAPLLKAWIVKRLEDTSDADADVLADYVLALLRHDGSIDDVRKLCEEEIPDFLKEDSSVFVRDVFEAIQYKSYLPGAPQPPKRPAANSQFEFSGLTMGGPPQLSMGLPPQNGNKKRSFHDRGEPDAPTGRDGPQHGGRQYKQPRRGGGRGGRGPGGFQGGMMQGPHQGAQQIIPAFDPNNPMEAILKMQQMGIPIPPMPTYSGGYQPPRGPQVQRRRGRCRDFESKGYCARGQNCMFEHAVDPMYVPPQGLQQGLQYDEEYNPNKSAMMMGGDFPALPPQFPPQAPPFTQQNGGRDQTRRKDSRQGNQGGQKRKGRAPFSADGPVHDRTKSTIVIENIPEEKFSEDEVRGFFSQFGNITEVSMQPYKHLAIVKFDNWNAANAAYRSPKVIFDNRFVKVFWFKENDGKSMPPSTPLNGGSTANGSKNGAADGGNAALSGSPEAEIDMEEFARKQEEAQKAHEEKMAKKQELEKMRLELEQRQSQLVAKQQEEKQKLLAKIAASSKKEGDASGDISMTPGTPGSKLSQTEALKAQLAALQAEANSLGIDPNAAAEAMDETGAWGAAGRGRGRGGLFRGRGGAPTRGFRGGYRGRGGGSGGSALYAQYSLDNRPKRIALTGVDFSAPEKDEALRQYLFTVAGFTDVRMDSSSAQITFEDRKSAESFYNTVAGPKQIPGIDGQVEPAWVNNTAGSSLLPSTTNTVDFATVAAGAQNGQTKSGPAAMAAAAAAVPEDVPMAGANGAENTAASNDHAAQQQDHVEMDYDVAGEDDWGVE